MFLTRKNLFSIIIITEVLIITMFLYVILPHHKCHITRKKSTAWMFCEIINLTKEFVEQKYYFLDYEIKKVF